MSGRQICGMEDGEEIAAQYSDAWGSSATKAGAAMIDVLQKQVLTSAISKNAVIFLEQHLVATYAAYKAAVEHAYGVVDRPTSALQPNGGGTTNAPVVRAGQSCLVVLVVGFIAGGVAYGMLHSVFTT